MVTSTTLNQQVWVGAGASATMIPEMNIYLDQCDGKGANPTTVDNIMNGSMGTGDNAFTLVPNLYVGCLAEIRNNTDTNFSGTAMITANTVDEITFDRVIGNGSDNNDIDVTILAFGAPSPAPSITMRQDTSTNTAKKPALLGDNWLGLVNTVSPPTVDVELGQLSLALAGRNYGYQFKKNETVSGGSIDLSLSNGSWLYYALGTIANVTHTRTTDDMPTSGTGTFALTGDTDGSNDSSTTSTDTKFIRSINGRAFPPTEASTFTGGADGQIADDGELHKIGTGPITYGFGESDGDALPSFALEITYEKDGLATDDYFVGSEGDSNEATARPFKDIYSRIFTGCQVNTLTLNFEEGQEVKTNLDLVSRRAFDSPETYVPKRNVRTASSLFNYSATDDDNQPYLFSGGTIEIFGQTVARVKSGSFTVNNNIAPQRFIGNYSRQVTSAHIPGQRTYEVSMNLLVTDTDIWDNLRTQGENTTETLTLKFQKSANDVIQIQLNDYLVQSLDVPFPEDKGPIEYAMTVSARSLVEGNASASTGTFYKGKWVIQNTD
tara:strand:+ start:4558 stop:6210 length:1653 start_codon:yes stop_codon:yes gene_type:complete